MKRSIVLHAALLLALSAQAAPPDPADCIYDYGMITEQECRDYRARVLQAASDEERMTLLRELNGVMDERARERGVTRDDWRGLAAPVAGAAASAPIWPLVAALLGALAAGSALAFVVLRVLRPHGRTRLMRCPETGTVAFVGADRVSHPGGHTSALTVRSCELWPGRSHCARGCLARYEEATSGLHARLAALRPFEQP
jgi:hypothetical protein